MSCETFYLNITFSCNKKAIHVHCRNIIQYKHQKNVYIL